MAETVNYESDIPQQQTSGDSTEELEGLILAYLTCPHDASKAFLGALLITNDRGHPLHFAYVSPIRPTVMQRILYGTTLNEHIKANVIVKKLFAQGLDIRPDIVFVDSDDLIQARRIINLPFAKLTHAPETRVEGTSLSAFQYDTDPNSDDDRTVGCIIASLEQKIDLLDAFSRMNEALKESLKSEQNK